MVALGNPYGNRGVNNLYCFEDVKMKMNKELTKVNKELTKEKFEKLSDTSKIRYNLGKIISMQFTILSFIMTLFGVILGIILFLPFMINYGSFYGSVCLVFLGVFLIIGMFILLIVEMYRIKEDEKSLEKFLMSEGKDE